MHSITEFLTQLLSGDPKSLGLGQSLIALVIAYMGGLLSSLTPCVYPMIPITVSVIGGMGGSGNKGNQVLKKRPWKDVCFRGLAYVGGMTMIYSFLGVIAGVSGKVFGSFTNHWSWYISLGVILTASSLVMLEVLPFDPAVWWDHLWGQFRRKVLNQKPSPRSSRLIQSAPEMTLAGAFLLGASSGFVAAPCTTPVLTSILAYIAKTQSIGLGFLLMFSFSLGLGTLLLVIASFAGALQVLPRSGHWMKKIKTASGLILLAFGEYLIYRAGSSGGP